MIANAFNTPRLCMISGSIKPFSLKATPKETQLFAKSKSEREKIVLADASNGIYIPTKADTDRRATFSKAAI